MTATPENRTDPAVRAERRPIHALLLANAVSTFGNNITALAVPWFILETTGSAVRTGLVGTSLALGSVVASVLGGPVIDRLGFKPASVVADVASFVMVLAIPLLYHAGVLQFWALLVLAFTQQPITLRARGTCVSCRWAQTTFTPAP